MEAIAKVFYGTPIKRMTAAQMTAPDEGYYVAIRTSEMRSAIGFALPLRPLVTEATWNTQLEAALAQHHLEAAGPAAWYLVSYLDV